MTLKPGPSPQCTQDNECRIAHTFCSPLGSCECDPGLYYDRALHACVRVFDYNQPCDLGSGSECRNDHMVCSEEEGLCKCEPGFSYMAGWSPFCQPVNASSCPLGQVWSAVRNQCIPRSVDIMFQPGAYDRNRYSLFFAVLLILLLMVILFKSKKPHPNPFPFGLTTQSTGLGGGVSTRNSCPDPYDPDILSIDDLDIRLAEAGLYRDPRTERPHRTHQHHRIQYAGGVSESFCVAYQPPPSYSSTLNLSRLERGREKPPSYEEAIRMPGPHAPDTHITRSQQTLDPADNDDPCHVMVQYADESPADDTLPRVPSEAQPPAPSLVTEGSSSVPDVCIPAPRDIRSHERDDALQKYTSGRQAEA